MDMLYSIADPNPTPQIIQPLSIDTHYGLAIGGKGNGPAVVNGEIFLSSYDGGTVMVIKRTGPLSAQLGGQIQNYRIPVVDNDIPDNSKSSIHTAPYDIAYNSKSRKLYVTVAEQPEQSTDNIKDKVVVINTTTEKIINNITVGKHPDGIAIDKDKNVIYVANRDSNTVSVINGTRDEVVKEIPSAISPSRVSLNPKSNLLYVTEADSNTVSVINTITKESVIAVNFNVNPSGYGDIYCKGISSSDSETKIIANYTMINVGAQVECEAKPNTGFTFSSWSGSGISSNQTNPLRFTVSKYAPTFTVNFVPTLTLDKYQALIVAYLAILGPISTVISLYGFILSRIRTRRLTRQLKDIDDLKHSSALNNEKYFEKLNEKREQVKALLKKGKIDESNYNLVDKIISEEIKNSDKTTSNSYYSGIGPQGMYITKAGKNKTKIKKYTSEGKVIEKE